MTKPTINPLSDPAAAANYLSWSGHIRTNTRAIEQLALEISGLCNLPIRPDAIDRMKEAYSELDEQVQNLGRSVRQA